MSSLPPSGYHRKEGVFSITSPSIRGDSGLGPLKIIDLVSTILYLMGEAISDDMDGRVSREFFKEEFLEKNPITFFKAPGPTLRKEKNVYSEEKARMSKKKLKASVIYR